MFGILVDEEGNNAISKALFKHYEPADTTVSVVEGVYLLECCVEISNVIQVERRLVGVLAEQAETYSCRYAD